MSKQNKIIFSFVPSLDFDSLAHVRDCIQNQNMMIFGFNKTNFTYSNYGFNAFESALQYLLCEQTSDNEMDANDIVSVNIICLCPHRYKNRIIGEEYVPEHIRSIERYETYLDESKKISIRDYHKLSVIHYCQSNNIKAPQFNYLYFDDNYPADSILDIMHILDKYNDSNSLLSIDISGAQQNAASFLPLLINLLKDIKYLDINIGSLMSYNNITNHVERINNTFEISDLASAVYQFIELGNGLQLSELFKTTKYYRPKDVILKLSERIKFFTESLLTCDLTRIKNLSHDIKDLIAKAKNVYDECIEKYPLYTELINIVIDADKNGGDFNSIKELLNFKNYSLPLGIECIDDIMMYLREEQEDNLIERKELLFSTLLDYLDKNFIKYENEIVFSLDIALWCAERNLIFQSLTIYREFLGKYLFECGIFNAKEAFNSYEGIDRHFILKDVCAACKLTPKSKEVYFYNKKWELPTSGKEKRYIDYSKLFEINASKVVLSPVLSDFWKLTKIRNEIFHGSVNDNKQFSLSRLKKLIIECINNAKKLYIDKSAFIESSSKTKNINNESSIEIEYEKLDYVFSMSEIRDLLYLYSKEKSGGRTCSVEYTVFRQWVEDTHAKEISREIILKSHNIKDTAQSICELLGETYPEDFVVGNETITIKEIPNYI